MSSKPAETAPGTAKKPSGEPGPTDHKTAGPERHGSVNPKQVDKKENEVTTEKFGKVVYGVQSFGQ